MMDDKQMAGVVTAVFGVITLAVALIPDLIGIGNAIQNQDYQMLGAILGALIVAVGLLLTFWD